MNQPTIADHIQIAAIAAEDCLKDHANPAIQAAIAQAHAQIALAMLLQQIVHGLEADNDPIPSPTWTPT